MFCLWNFISYKKCFAFDFLRSASCPRHIFSRAAQFAPATLQIAL
jgi:hypothetical protein